MKLLFENWRKYTNEQYYYYGDTQANIVDIVENSRIKANRKGIVASYKDTVPVQEIIQNVESIIKENEIDDIPAVIRFKADTSPTRTARTQAFWDTSELNIKEIDIAQLESKEIL